MGVYSLVFFGSMPIGSLFAGSMAEKIGEPHTVMLGAGILLVLALVTWVFLREIRRQE
jgi:fucose permease